MDEDTGEVLLDQLSMTNQDTKLNSKFTVKFVKEHDLVFFSGDMFKAPENDIKRITNLDFLRNNLSRQDAFFGFVIGKNNGNPKDPNQSIPSIDCLID